MLVVCAGMCRSGSTWQYLVACDLLERTGPGERLGFLTPPEFARASLEPPKGRWRVFKTHDGHADFAEVLANSRARGLYCYRDLRDVAFSLAHKWSVSLRTAVVDRVGVRNCIANHAFWTAQPNVFIQRYEDWVRNPAEYVARIAKHLGVELGSGEAEDIARRYSSDENRRRTDALAARLRTEGVDLTDPRNTLLSDPNTLLHWNHLRSGEVGGWRAQSRPEDLALLARECGEWLAQNGYEDHPAWAALAGAVEQQERLANGLEQARVNLAIAAQRETDLDHGLQRTQALLAAERDANDQLRSVVEDLQGRLTEATRTLNGAWSCLPHRVVRWLRGRIASSASSWSPQEITTGRR
jgi:Sulfotransferase domain